VLVVSVVVDVSFFWQPRDSPRIPIASREASAESFLMK
jgi:hypothetical protein